MRWVLGLAAAGLLVLGGCSEADDGNDRRGAVDDVGGVPTDEFVAATVDALAENDQMMASNEAHATCVAEGLVATVGVDRLNTAGISPDEFADAEDLASLDVDLPDDAATQVSAVFDRCDSAATMIRFLVDYLSTEIDSALAEDDASCVLANIDEPALNDALGRLFVDSSSANQDRSRAIIAPMGSCPRVLAAVLLEQVRTESGVELSDTATTCANTYVADNAAEIASATAEATPGTIDEGLLRACPELAEAT